MHGTTMRIYLLLAFASGGMAATSSTAAVGSDHLYLTEQRGAVRETPEANPDTRSIALLDPDTRHAAARDFARVLVARLVRDLLSEQEIAWRSPSMDRFRSQLIHSSDVIESGILIPHLQESGELMELASRPGPVQESAMRVLLSIGIHRHAMLREEINAIEIPDGPDHPAEFQPRPQAGGAIGGSFTEFISDDEREKYERNYDLLRRRNQFKALRSRLEREFVLNERDVRRLIGSIDSMCDADGKAMLRRMLHEAGTLKSDFLTMWLLDEPAAEPGAAVTPAPDSATSNIAPEAIVQKEFQPPDEIMAFNAVLSSIASAASADRPCPEALGVLSASLRARARDVPPHEVLAALPGHASFLEASRRPDATGQLLVRLALDIAMEACTRVERDWRNLEQITPKKLPDMPAFVLRFGGAVVGGGQARAAVPPFRNEAEREAFAAWQAEEQATLELQRSLRQAMAQSRMIHGTFRRLARDLYFHADELHRTAIVSHLAAASGDGVDYLKLAGLRPIATVGDD